jgi:hypothetical protein
VRDEERRPGTYTIQAVYEYNTLKAVSEPVLVGFQDVNAQK